VNIIHLIRAIPIALGEIFLSFVTITLAVLSLFLVLPFCRKEDTIDAGYRWFAWYPVFVGNRYAYRIKDFRWLVFVGRRGDGFGLVVYEDLGDKINEREFKKDNRRC
jgi:hypothetical protein